jgi:hypothetical protein
MRCGVFLISRLRDLVAVAVVGLILAGCSATAPSSVAGTWTGSLVDALAGPATLQYTLSQSGSSLTGTWSSKFPAAANPVTGTLAGTLSGSTVTLILAINNSSCQESVTGTVSGPTMTGTYSDDNCGAGDGGTFTLQLQ